MSEESVIGGEGTQEQGGEEGDEPVIGGPAPDATEGDATNAALAELLREALLAAHDDLSPEDLAGETAEDVRERYVAVRARLEGEAREAKGTQVPAGAPGRFAPVPANAFEKIREGLARLGA